MIPLWTYITKYVPDALVEAVRVSVAGNMQHNPHLAPQDIWWDRSKSTDELNTAIRHLFDHSTGTVRDADGQYHLAKAYWRIGAALQKQIEEDRRIEDTSN
jgi:hypothetical protein